MSNHELEVLTGLEKGTKIDLFLTGAHGRLCLTAEVVENLLVADSLIQWVARLKEQGVSKQSGWITPQFVSAYGSLRLKPIKKPVELSTVPLDPVFLMDVNMLWQPESQTFHVQCRIPVGKTVAFPVMQLEVSSVE